MKKKWITVLIVLSIYLLLLIVLALSESASNGGIHSFMDALWYSLVTMTTVGYGDVVPATGIGKFVGILFMILSVGFLTCIISAVLAIVTGSWLPEFRLFLNKRKQWWIFSEKNENASALAEDLVKNHPGTRAVFCRSAIGKSAPGRICCSDTPEKLLKNGTFSGGERVVFVIGRDEALNRAEAVRLVESGTEVFCCTDEIDHLAGVICFNPREAFARQYWKARPVTMKDKRILIIGDGTYAKALLDRAVIMNCMTPFHALEYHVVGMWDEYRKYHSCLENVIAMDRPAEDSDAFFFHDTFTPELLKDIDRVIICGDDRRKNAEIASNIAVWCVCAAPVHILSDDITLPGESFGSATELYTESLVMKQEQDRLAGSMHETYRKGSKDAPTWDELSPFLKASNRAAADHLQMKQYLLSEFGCRWEELDDETLDKCRRNEHDRWLRFHSLYGWQYAPKRNNELRQHPCIMPYEQLSEANKLKDDYAWQQLALLRKRTVKKKHRKQNPTTERNRI